MKLFVDIEKNFGRFCLRAKFETNGDVTGLLGASGCGKSMTLRCIAGIEKPDRGCIILDGETLFDSKKRINLPPQKRKVGYLFQNYALFPNMTVRQNLLAGLFWEKNRANREKALEEAAALLHLEGLLQHRPAQLSGGQAQRAALGRILLSKPRFLLLDEPFSALDSHLRDQLQLDMLALLQKMQLPSLLVTHSRDEAYHMCGSLLLMHDGKIVRSGKTKEVFADPQSSYAAHLTGCKNLAAAEKVDDHTVWVKDWGVSLSCADAVEEGLTGIGIRAHYFHPNARQNRLPVFPVNQVEEPFEWILQFRFPSQKEGTPSVWWRIPKEKKPAAFPAELGVAPENVLLFYDGRE